MGFVGLGFLVTPGRFGDGTHLDVSCVVSLLLAAFLWAINELVRGEWKNGTTRVIYISPLKALNNDIRRNLLKPLSELKEYLMESKVD